MSVRCPLAALAAALLVCLSGCGSTHPDNTVHPVTTGFSCDTTIHYHEMELQGTLTRDAGGALTLSFSMPKTLDGVSIGWDGTAMSMELGGMRIAVPTDKVPQGALVQRLLQVLAAEHGDGTVTEEGYVISGDVGGDAYTLVCDPDTGLPDTLSLPAEELEATFTNAVSTGVPTESK